MKKKENFIEKIKLGSAEDVCGLVNPWLDRLDSFIGTASDSATTFFESKTTKEEMEE
ncbi:MAG: hypothetical protein ACI8Y9_000957 [Paracoccaceae bacterium]|jgi:hypothetical protein